MGRFADKVITGKIQKELLGFTLSFPWTIKLYTNFFGEGHLFSLILLPVMEYRIRSFSGLRENAWECMLATRITGGYSNTGDHSRVIFLFTSYIYL